MDDLSSKSFKTLIGRTFRLLSVHPYTSMYKIDEFVAYLNYIGFDIVAFREFNPWGLIKFFMLCAKLKK